MHFAYIETWKGILTLLVKKANLASFCQNVNKIHTSLSERRPGAGEQVQDAKLDLVSYKEFTVALNVFKAKTHCPKWFA